MPGSNRPLMGRARSPLSASPSDEVLLQRVAGADHEAFEELYARLAPPVYGLALCVAGDRTAAEEVTQQVFMQVWSKAAHFGAVPSRVPTSTSRVVRWARTSLAAGRSAGAGCAA